MRNVGDDGGHHHEEGGDAQTEEERFIENDSGSKWNVLIGLGIENEQHAEECDDRCIPIAIAYVVPNSAHCTSIGIGCDMENSAVPVGIVHEIALGEVHSHINGVGVFLPSNAMGDCKGRTKLNLVSDVFVIEIFHDHRLLRVELEQFGRRIDVQVPIVPQIVNVRAVIDAQLPSLSRSNLRFIPVLAATSALIVISANEWLCE